MTDSAKTTDDAAVQAVMVAAHGHEIAAAAFAMFDAWRERQSEDVRDLDLLEQVALYAEAMSRE